MILFFILFSLPAQAGLLELDSLAITYEDFYTRSYDHLMPASESPNQRLSIDLNIDLFSIIGFDNRVHGATNESQFRTVGWQYSLYARITPMLELGLQHHSQHLLDTYPIEHFPLEDTWFIRFKLFEKQEPRKAVFE